MTEDNYRFTARVAQKWRRVSITPTSEYRINGFIDSLMRQRPDGIPNRSVYGLDLLKRKDVFLTPKAWSGQRNPRPYDKIPHGESGSYTNHGCRCEECRAAWNKYMQEYRRKKKAREH
jgi:hypothetical protein